MGRLHPRVAVITPTWQRHEKLLNRCIPSVQAQVYARGIQHVIVSDGPDPELASKLMRLSSGQAFIHPVIFVQLPEHSPDGHWGHSARLAGIEASASGYVAYIDDDDVLRPEHVPKLTRALDEHPEAGFAYSQMIQHSRVPDTGAVLGGVPPLCGQIGTPMIMHRREILEHGTWGPASATEDWELVQRWLHAGIPYVHIPEVTVDVWPSAWWHSE